MADTGFHAWVELILGEIQAVLPGIRADEVQALEDAILQARAVFVTGQGRSGLLGRCFAMRLMHLGRQAHVVGESVTPALRPGDLLVAISGSGETDTTVSRARAVVRVGGRVAAVTASPESALARVAGLRVVIPAPPASGSAQYGRSLFEQCCFLMLEAVVLDLQHRLGCAADDMQARHATVE